MSFRWKRRKKQKKNNKKYNQTPRDVWYTHTIFTARLNGSGLRRAHTSLRPLLLLNRVLKLTRPFRTSRMSGSLPLSATATGTLLRGRYRIFRLLCFGIDFPWTPYVSVIYYSSQFIGVSFGKFQDGAKRIGRIVFDNLNSLILYCTYAVPLKNVYLVRMYV